jgi:hypothetical protein
MQFQDAVQRSSYKLAFRRTTFGRIALVDHTGLVKRQVLERRELYEELPGHEALGYDDWEPFEDFAQQFKHNTVEWVKKTP